METIAPMGRSANGTATLVRPDKATKSPGATPCTPTQHDASTVTSELRCGHEGCDAQFVHAGGKRAARTAAEAQGWRYTWKLIDGTKTWADMCPQHKTKPMLATEPDDEALEMWGVIQQAQAGDKQAFGVVFSQCRDTVWRFVYLRTGNGPLADDITQDTFVRALRQLQRFTWQGKPPIAWLLTIAHNLVIDEYRRGRSRLEVVTGDVIGIDRADQHLASNPEAAVMAHITNITLLSAVKQLKPDQQECVVLRILCGLSVLETARVMGKTGDAIKTLLYRAIGTLRKLLPEGFAEQYA